MPDLSFEEKTKRYLSADVSVTEFLSGLIDATDGRIAHEENHLLDFKRLIELDKQEAIGELARDILAFSNTDGGVILVGVSDNREVLGNEPVNPAYLRQRLGLFLGTRIDYEISNADMCIRGRTVRISTVGIRKADTAYPALLRKHIEIPGKLGRKVKYLEGSLFYRKGDQTLVEPIDGDVDLRAKELGFTGASPRTRSSFLLVQDTPGTRLYSHINDRFIGRIEETAELVAKFDDVRGRGISIAGQGGIGKTELAIEIIHKLFKSGKFRSIYSGSAKRNLLGIGGPQSTDPVFFDFPSFLRDLTSWLGFEAQPNARVEDLKARCLAELGSKPKTLLFVDNLETVEDGRLFAFLDRELPANVYLITTSRVHKIKNWIYTLQLGSLKPRDAATLLRHEFTRQGLQEYASKDIGLLESVTAKLYYHPLAIRWYAWACKRNPENWIKGPENIPKEELEAFCVASTLGALGEDALRVLSAIAITQGQIDLNTHCVEAVSSVNGIALDMALYDLECAGLITSVVIDETGEIRFKVVPLAINPAKEIARKNAWEKGFVQSFHRFIEKKDISIADDPLLADLLQYDPRNIAAMLPNDIDELKSRINRVNKRPHAYKIEMSTLLGECERQKQNPTTADEHYRTAADLILQNSKLYKEKRYQSILIEAATVAKRASHTDAQLRRAVHYLEVINDSSFFALRILGTLVELYAMLGIWDKYQHYLTRANSARSSRIGHTSQQQIWGLDEALLRAKNCYEAAHDSKQKKP